MTDTRWFVKKPDGDTYYGRIYNGKVYELIPAGLPEITIEDGRAYVEEGPLEYYPGIILDDSDANTVFADEGRTVLKDTGASGNLGGYMEYYYTATRDRMEASITADGGRVTVNLDSVSGDTVIDRTALRSLLSFIATAMIGKSITSVNVIHASYNEYTQNDLPVPVDKPFGVSVYLGRLPIEKQVGF